MNCPTPKHTGNVELWTARLPLAADARFEAVQAKVTRSVSETGISVIGYFMESPRSLTLLHWPENREDYPPTEIEDCELALAALIDVFQVRDVERDIVPANTLHTMMGRRMGGYDTATIAPFEVLAQGLPADTVRPAHMVSARVRHNAPVEPYGEPVGIITVEPTYEDAIHELGYELEQFHYAIERGPTGDEPGRTDFYETQWVTDD
jgi:hypothetical protein